MAFLPRPLRKLWSQGQSLLSAFRYGEDEDQLLGSEEVQALQSEGRTPTLLAFHGFGGSPQEVELFCQAGAELGLATRAPLLPGHGSRAAELAQLRYEDMLEAARAELVAAEERGPVILAGLSMGALLAFELSLERPNQVRGLVLASAAFRLAEPYPDLGLRLWERLQLPDLAIPKRGPDLGDADEASKHPSYRLQPVRAAISLRLAGLRLEPRLGELRVPLLLMHGLKDRVCPMEAALAWMQGLERANTEFALFSQSHHILTRDCERSEVKARTLRFLAQHSGELETGPPSVAK